MAFTLLWDSAFEAAPSDVADISEGAARIREERKALRERLEIDHEFSSVSDVDADSGKHKKITFVDPLASDPTVGASEGIIYTKDVSAKAELFYRDEDANVIQITTSGKLSGFPSGTGQVFLQTSAPPGWTIDATHDDRLLRVDGAAGATTAGSWTISGVTVDGHSLTEAENGPHTHTYSRYLGGWVQGQNDGSPNLWQGILTQNTSSSGSGTAHNHGLTSDAVWRPSYVDVIHCSKD